MDPITIGLAFSAAQTAVSHIKQAIALGATHIRIGSAIFGKRK